MTQQTDYIHPVHNVYDGCYSSFTKKKIDLINPTADMICLEDIANALSKICRFGGHIPDHYSVAQHTLVVMTLAPKELKHAALLHDAAEAYLGDVVKPLKVLLGTPYERIEAQFEALIFHKYGVSISDLRDIKPYDMEALEIEHDYFFKKRPIYLTETVARINGDRINTTWDYSYANRRFLDALKETFGMEVQHA